MQIQDFLTVKKEEGHMKMNRMLSVLLALALLVGCAGASAQPALQDGVFAGAAMGMGGELAVEVTVENGAMTAVEVTAQKETPGISDPALEQLPAAILAAQSTDVDDVSGATITSKAIKGAVEAALLAAQGVEAGQESTVVYPEKADIVVVGYGFAGMNAALEAANRGAHVVLLEKTEQRGGSMRLAGGTLSGAGTKIQAEQGIEDSPELFYEEIVSRNAAIGGEANYLPDVSKYYCEHSGEAVDWLDSLGCDMGERTAGQPSLYQPMKVARVYSTGKSASYLEKVGELVDAQVAAGTIETYYNATADSLVQQADGAITGVVFTGADGVQRQIDAGAVILCTGGYGHSEEMLKKYNFTNVLTTAPASNTGDGLRMAVEAGAAVKNMDYCSTYAGGLYTSASGFVRSQNIRIKDYPYMIFVNTQGERFCDELGNADGTDYDAITSWWKKGDNIVYIVFDEAMIDALRAEDKPVISGDKDWSKFDKAVQDAESIFVGDTLEAAAAAAGVDAAGLAATIERYNGFAASGKDEDFGRTRLMKEFTGGKYYILRTMPYVMITSGGPVMNDRCEVLREDGTPIPGLYQAGEIAGNAAVIGHTTLGGVSNTDCVVFGKRAAECAVEYALCK